MNIFHTSIIDGKLSVYPFNSNQNDYFDCAASELEKILYVTTEFDFFISSKSTYDETHEKLKPHHVKFIDLSVYDFDWAEIRLTKNITYKSISRLDTMQKITRYIADSRENIYSGKSFEKAIYDAFDEHFHNFDFFKYKEKRHEFIFTISLIKNKKTVERLKFNYGQLSLIYCPKFFSVVDRGESKEAKPTRSSNTNPVYLVENKQYLAEFNPRSYYVETVEQCRLINEIQEI